MAIDIFLHVRNFKG